jgi:hypothetical protein
MQPLPADLLTLLADILYGDSRARAEAIRRAPLAGTLSIAFLGRICRDGSPGAARAAWEAIQRIAFNATRPNAPAIESESAQAALCRIAGDAQNPRALRTAALRLVGCIGQSASVKPVAAMLTAPDMREEARAALEQIPAAEAETALRSALRSAPADFRPALEQSLKNRRLKWNEIGIRR